MVSADRNWAAELAVLRALRQDVAISVADLQAAPVVHNAEALDKRLEAYGLGLRVFLGDLWPVGRHLPLLQDLVEGTVSPDQAVAIWRSALV